MHFTCAIWTLNYPPDTGQIIEKIDVKEMPEVEQQKMNAVMWLAVPKLLSMCGVIREVFCEVRIGACFGDVHVDVWSVMPRDWFRNWFRNLLCYLEFKGQQNATEVLHILWFLIIDCNCGLCFEHHISSLRWSRWEREGFPLFGNIWI